MRRFSVFWFVLCVAVIAFWTVLPPPSGWLERVYGGLIYPAIAGVLVPLSGSLELPVTALLLGALVLLGVLGVTLSKNRRRGAAAFWRGLWRVWVTAVTVYALFIVLWGANYGKTPLETRLKLSTDEPDMLETVAMAEVLSNVLRQDFDALENWDDDLSAAKTSLNRVVVGLEGRPATLPRFIKRTPSGFLIFTGRATGITVPWTLEAYIDRALPYPFALATALHETAHVAGYAGEAEADFVAALAGLTSDSAGVRYATALPLFLRVGQNLQPERYQAILNYLPPKTSADIAAFSGVFARYRAPAAVAQVQTRFYDSYLKSQRVGAGIDDYDRVIVLLMAAKRDELLDFNWEDTTLTLP